MDRAVTGTVEEAVSEDVETEWIDPFAAYDFSGQAFRVSSSIESGATNADAFIRGSGELNGEMVNDAVYNRNQKISELLDIKFEFTECTLYLKGFLMQHHFEQQNLYRAFEQMNGGTVWI